MTANAFEGTAKIYQFPKGGRAGLSSGRFDANTPAPLASMRIAKVAYDGVAYHEAAIREEERARKS